MLELQAVGGGRHALSDHDEPWVVVAFLGTECPLAKLYGSRLEDLRTAYAGKQVAFLGIST